MVLLDENPATLIAHVVENFGADSDITALERIQANIRITAEARARKLDAMREEIAALERELAGARAQTAAAEENRAKRDHEKTMMELDREKFTLAREILEADAKIHELHEERARTDEEIARLEEEMSHLEGDKKDETALKLKIYRGLGIELVKDEAGNYTKAVLRKKGERDVQVVKLDGSHSQSYITDYIWDNI
ncbi:Spc24-domain-containing protein [Ascobolus immersus RN42]|uniref:Kinetochore protein Spc24 n=1 Tax=Ascobolus immersus RN42 TaxID=1160509 RepID=A0A3N4IBL8_ASCIM|nr:Spc24-domain-containing protein [Ascobolus immersus RN42]